MATHSESDLRFEIGHVLAPVISAEIEDRATDTRRYRLHMLEWTLWYWTPSDAGALLNLIVPTGSTPKLEILAYFLGFPRCRASRFLHALRRSFLSNLVM